MDMRFLGGCGLRVSALGFGTMTFGGRGPFFDGVGSVGTAEDCRKLIDICLGNGVNLFDTADVYSQGLSEELLGQALGKRRQEVIVATKAHGRTGDSPNDVGQSRHHLLRACEASLRRLRTDYIDIYQLHGFDASTPLEETLRALDHLVTSGKVRYLGCSNFSAWHLMKALSVAERLGSENLVSHQVYYSLLGREAEFELVPLAKDQRLGLIVWGPLAGGFLSGKYREGESDPDNTRKTRLGLDGVPSGPQRYRIINALTEVAHRHSATVGQAALNWLMAKPYVSSILVGARTAEQLQENLDAATWELASEELQHLDEISAPAPIYPYWHQRKYNAERLPG
jgi:aryl-alcohol dehydrogenase-like predicted oxidoreductase